MNLASYINLCKPKIVLLLTITALVGMLLSINFYSNILDGLASLLGFALLAGASAALNQIFDRETDKNMNRTKTRPLASGEISLFSALTFTAILLFVGSSLLLYFSNLLTLLITTFGFIFYSLIYTIYLKWSTPQNIVIGGAAGALPPVIGWTISTGTIAIEPIILFLIIFFWTPSHFWALSLYKSGDYKKAKIPMLPIISGIEKTKLNILIYAVIMIPIVAAPYFFNFGSMFYLLTSSVMTFYYVYLCYGLFKTKNIKKSNILARKIFIYSIFYLFFLFVLILFDNIIRII